MKLSTPRPMSLPRPSKRHGSVSVPCRHPLLTFLDGAPRDAGFSEKGYRPPHSSLLRTDGGSLVRFGTVSRFATVLFSLKHTHHRSSLGLSSSREACDVSRPTVTRPMVRVTSISHHRCWALIDGHRPEGLRVDVLPWAHPLRSRNAAIQSGTDSALNVECASLIHCFVFPGAPGLRRIVTARIQTRKQTNE